VLTRAFAASPLIWEFQASAEKFFNHFGSETAALAAYTRPKFIAELSAPNGHANLQDNNAILQRKSGPCAATVA